MRATVGKMATLKQVAAIGEVSLDTLIKDIAAAIESHTGEGAEFETVGKDGGLLIAPTHMLEPEGPWENILAFFEAVDEFGRY